MGKHGRGGGRSRRRRGALGGAIVTAVSLLAPGGCFLDDAGTVTAGGGGGPGATSATTTTTTTTTTGTTTTSSSTGPECQAGDLCDDDNPCTADSCVEGQCEHTPTSGTPDDGNPCTADSCADGAEVHTNLGPEVACGEPPLHCDGAGHCVGCAVAGDCPAAIECQSVACEAQVCVYSNDSQGSGVDTTPTNDCKKTQCDGLGAVETVTDAADVPGDDGRECTVETCVGDQPTHAPKDVGTACQTGVCNAAGECVTCAGAFGCGPGQLCFMEQACFSCSDGQKNGDEADVDCGGSCAECPVGATCNAGGDCQNGECNAGICQDLTCTNSAKDGAETDVDCGGSECPTCLNGLMCAAPSDCQSSSCEQGLFGDICCGGACSGSCFACDLPFAEGTCSVLPSSFNGIPPCPVGQTCSGGVNGCVATAKKTLGVACGSNGECHNNTCKGGFCKLVANDFCVADIECGSGRCFNNKCAPCGNDGECASGKCTSPGNNGVCKLVAGSLCAQDSDCFNNKCSSNLCGVQNGQSCQTDDDCASKRCSGGTCASCANGGECVSGLCAAGNCKQVAGKSCASGAQCASGLCAGTALNPFTKCQ
jgi:hypothetical protein